MIHCSALVLNRLLHDFPWESSTYLVEVGGFEPPLQDTVVKEYIK